jgi:hypothetical protein
VRGQAIPITSRAANVANGRCVVVSAACAARFGRSAPIPNATLRTSALFRGVFIYSLNSGRQCRISARAGLAQVHAPGNSGQFASATPAAWYVQPESTRLPTLRSRASNSLRLPPIRSRRLRSPDQMQNGNALRQTGRPIRIPDSDLASSVASRYTIRSILCRDQCSSHEQETRRTHRFQISD